MEIIELPEDKKAVEIIELNDKTVTKMRYGLIRIVGENYLREITWDTYQYLKKLPADFKGIVEIQELNLTVAANQIVKMEQKEKESISYKSFTQLPTELVYLDRNFAQLKGIRKKIEQDNDVYYSATCHYVVRDGVKQYFLERHQIQYLVELVRDESPDYPHYVKNAWRYGRDVREIQKEHGEKKRR